MARVRIDSGVCGFWTTVETEADDMMQVSVKIESNCQHCQALARELTQVSPFKEISPRGGGVILELSRKHLAHAACPVPAGVVKAVEVAAGLALPRPASITFEE